MRKQGVFVVDQDHLAVQDSDECESEREARTSSQRCPQSPVHLLLRQLSDMGIQVRRVQKPNGAAAYDHASQTEPNTQAGKTTGGAAEGGGGGGGGGPAAAPRPRLRLYIHGHKRLLVRVYRIFGLRHGTMMIALHDLLWSSFVVFLLVLATAHTREVSRIVEDDMHAHMAEHAAAERADHMASLSLSDQDNQNRSSYYMQYVQLAYDQARSMVAHDNNEVKLHTGMHVATMMTMMMVFGISMAGIDMIASMMLFAGALLHVRQLMMPWLSLRLIETMLLVGFSLVIMVVYARGVMLCKVFVVSLIVVCVISYHWTAAYSLHESICRLERTGNLVHSTRSAGPINSFTMVTSGCGCGDWSSRGAGGLPRHVNHPDMTYQMMWGQMHSGQMPNVKGQMPLRPHAFSFAPRFAPWAPTAPSATATGRPGSGPAPDKNDLLTGSNRNLSATSLPELAELGGLGGIGDLGDLVGPLGGPGGLGGGPEEPVLPPGGVENSVDIPVGLLNPTVNATE